MSETVNPETEISRPTIIDVEASGFGPYSYPIEIGVALGDGTKYCTLVSPAPDWTFWDDDAEKVNRIPRDILEEHGRAPEDVARELNELLDRRTVYTDGWVVDKPWIVKLYERARIAPTFQTSSLEMILTEDQMALWHGTKDAVLDDLALKRHRASYDAFVIQETRVRTKAGIAKAD